ncbi:MAG: PTS sugar transporter subunit IIA [Lysobacter sp.]
MALRNLLSAERIAILIESLNRAAVLDAAARLLAGPTPAIPSQNSSLALARTIGDGLREREQLASTAIGHGVAIPHARIAGIDEGRCAFLRLAHPIDFNAADGKPVDLVLALAMPEHHVQQHLELLADFAASFADPGYRAELRAAPTIDLLRRRLLDGDELARSA